ncbi:hypothetical protein V7114_21565 [Neobacillus niacini]|uniref:hypothetical protein n=1 Tax=Neobacillus niacini TaxID=86668 RepID=UPI002FFF619E
MQSKYICGNHPENDVKAGWNLGMKGIWKKDFLWNELEADVIVTDLDDIPYLI